MTLYDRLQDLAYNLRWDWHAPTREMFAGLDPVLWEQVDRNPVALLRRLDPESLEGVDGLPQRVDALWQDLHDYLTAEGGVVDGHDARPDRPLVAYFSAEFGLTSSLRIYSGGLGVLAGDHLKSASDLRVPLVAVGLLYREGYFVQEVGPDGRQHERFPAADLSDLPLREVRRRDGSSLRVAVPFPQRPVSARVWRVDVGRVPLFLLDTDLADNTDHDRRLTSRLYGGDQEMRIEQELLLGIGGCRALGAMGIRPRSFHMNEGHSAFLGFEFVRDLVQEDRLGLDEAVETVRRRMVFTTHTPVPAGHDRFPLELMERYFTSHARSLGVPLDQLLELGRLQGDELFTMTVLAIRLAEQVNGVSRLHAEVTREMWKELWPDRPVEEVPIDHITNGVHLPTWVAPEIAAVYGVEVGALGFGAARPDPDPAELWRGHRDRRARLVEYVRGATGARFDPEVLTLAFARRFATYKRATLLLGDLDRLATLLANPHRPVQVVFAGKAHPRDEGGKALIRRIVDVARDDRFRDRITFVPGYGMDVARPLVQGADVWLNNPRRPMEASGTSGMKAAANGVLNVSILDGWWDEAWSAAAEAGARIGWAIGGRAPAASAEEADQRDGEDLFAVLERDVVPMFYDRDTEGVPRAWVQRMVDAIRHVAPYFNTHRMLLEYVERYQRAAAAADAIGSPR